MKNLTEMNSQDFTKGFYYCMDCRFIFHKSCVGSIVSCVRNSNVEAKSRFNTSGLFWCKICEEVISEFFISLNLR